MNIESKLNALEPKTSHATVRLTQFKMVGDFQSSLEEVGRWLDQNDGAVPHNLVLFTQRKDDFGDPASYMELYWEDTRRA